MNDTKGNINVDILNYAGIKGSMIAIVTGKDEINKVFKNALLMTSNLTPVTNRNYQFWSSNNVSLFIIRHDNKHKDPENSKWNDSLLNIVKKNEACVRKVEQQITLILRDT